MRKFLKRVRGATLTLNGIYSFGFLVSCLTLFSLSSPTAASADGQLPSSYSPLWSGTSPTENENGSFMGYIESSINLSHSNLSDKVMSMELSTQIKAEYSDLNKDYEFRKSYHLLTTEEERQHVKRVSEFAQSVLDRMKNYVVQDKLDKIRVFAEKEPLFAKVKTPVAVVTLLAAIYHGREVKFKLSDSAHGQFKADVPGKRGQLLLSTAWGDASLDYVPGAPSVRDPRVPAPEDPMQREERVRFSVSRPIAFLGIRTGITYASTTSLTSFSVSRPLTSNLIAQIDTSRYLRSQYGIPQETLQFNYSFRF